MRLFTRTPRAEYLDLTVETVLPALQSETEAAPCCGWFDSSHELLAGLKVTEFEQPDQVVNALPLDWWVDWACAGRRSAV